MSPTAYDVVIVGGGVIGSAAAYFLAASADFTGRVAVVEKDPSYQSGATGRSAGSIRQQFSTPENVAISRFGAAFLKSLPEHLAVDGQTPDPQFQEKGYLFLAGASGLDILRHNHAVQRAGGAQVALLEPAELHERFPWMRIEDLAGGSLGLADEGWFDPFALLQAFRAKARSLGVDYLNDEVVGLELEAGRVQAAKLASGGRLACGWLINAAGIQGSRVAAMAEIDIPVHPRKRNVFVFDCRTPLPHCPLVIDPSGLYFRPEGEGFICGISPGEGEADPDCEDLEVEHALFEERLWPLLAERVPAFEAIKPTGAWAGHYDVNSFDHNAILGPHPEITNFLFANGFSGHGLQQSPAVGRGLMECIVHGGWQSLDLSAFSFARLREGRPLREVAVV
ncbi:NAD(P)/FAD-dependent oxidoreductase [Aquibaculum arenosum]|uniref:FAD-binding oxidoreductase n=1 Tax=Aquibaculum arenosum TaxID=3032591 RepID=A0ABT5YKV2_9PROT|nr:FAD-binding oxidoreductase [Fodinicurvata sp. CAU 1616]MDF2095554.1 FAD-binding oxidoreductase [Fodinicurvata sp. CAU 1616]